MAPVQYIGGGEVQSKNKAPFSGRTPHGSPWRTPGFPVEFAGVDELHAAFFSVHGMRILVLGRGLLPSNRSVGGAAPVFFGPCTLGRTRGTRPEPWPVVYEVKSAGSNWDKAVSGCTKYQH